MILNELREFAEQEVNRQNIRDYKIVTHVAQKDGFVTIYFESLEKGKRVVTPLFCKNNDMLFTDEVKASMSSWIKALLATIE